METGTRIHPFRGTLFTTTIDLLFMAQLLDILATFLTGAAFVLGYYRYRAYVNEVQRDLFTCLEGRTYPRHESEHGFDEIQFEVVNVDVKTHWLINWNSIVVLKLHRDEFPWEDSNIDDFDFGSSLPESVNPASEKDADSINELMETELLRMCNFTRKSRTRFKPEFMDSVYGPTLFLHFPTTNLFLIREELEEVSNVIPILFAVWVPTIVGLDTKFAVDTMKALVENPEFREGFEQDTE